MVETPLKQALNIIIGWPVWSVKNKDWATGLIGAGFMYYWLGGQFSGQPPMQLVQAYLLAGGADYAYLWAMSELPANTM